jgi:hypothetical protein
MISKIMKFFDRNTVIAVIITSIITLFYSYVIFGIYILALILLIIIRYRWDIFDLKKFNSALKNITVSVVTIFILTFLCELWLQLYPHLGTGIDGVDVVGEFSDYTSRGYLTEDIFNKKKDVIRILTLGDSFSVYLRDKQQNYNNFLQQKYIGSGRGDVEIVNAGMEAMGPGYYWHVINNIGDLIKPDLIIVGFFVGNDFEEADFSVYIGNFIIEPKNLYKRYLKYDQFRHWRLYRLLKNKYSRYRDAQRKKEEAKSQPSQPVGTFSQETYLEVEKKRSWLFDKNNWGLLNQQWRECSEIILKMKDWCDRRQVKLVIAILPEQFQVDQALRQAVLAKYNHIAAENLDLSYPDNLIVNFCRTHNIHCLDLLGQFQEQGKSRPLYSVRDSHWNAAGNRLAADLIFEYLDKNQLLPPRPSPGRP